ncbi:MAG: hypothetical protein LBQ22_01890 [Bacteroidales bacterium]|jgi:hypothetical protein|nr:hypothetical protein [Bacteroidales bacterium]
MLKLSVRIEVIHEQAGGTGKKIEFNNVNSINITTSIENFTDLCKITLPRKARFEGTDITKIISPDDKITVQLGYDDNLRTVFRGYITKISTTIPLTIECENEGYKLKRIKTDPKTYPDFDIEDFCKENIPGFSLKVNPCKHGKIFLDQEMSLTAALNFLKESLKIYNYYFFFREEKNESIFYGIYDHSQIPENNRRTGKFEFGKNVIDSSLKLTMKKDINTQVITQSISSGTETSKPEGVTEKWPVIDNEKYKKETHFIESLINYDPVSLKKTLSELAKLRHENLTRDTMEGTITTFGEPFVRKGDVAFLIDENVPEHNNKKFLITGVTYNFGQSGYRQILTLGGEIK